MNGKALQIIGTAIVAFVLGVYFGAFVLHQNSDEGAHAALVQPQVETIPPATATESVEVVLTPSDQPSRTDGPEVAADLSDVLWGAARGPGQTNFHEVGNEESMRLAAKRAVRQQYADFFLLSDISSSEAEVIIQEIADLKLEHMRLTDSPEWFATIFGGAREDDAATMAVFDAMRDLELKEEQALGIHLESYRQHRMQGPYTRIVANVTRSLGRRLNSTTRDELLRIIIDESQGSPGVLATTPEEAARRGLESSRERDARIKERARSYLTYDEYESLVRTLDRETDRQEAQMRLNELSRQP